MTAAGSAAAGRPTPHTSSATSTIIRNFAHCSSSVSVLPSSVEAKPHCGDSASCSSGTNFAASSMRRLMVVLGFELAGLGGDEAEHHDLALRHEPQRLEAAGALGVVFHEIAVHVGAVEQHLGLGVVAAGAHEGRFVVAAAQMHRDRHVGGNVRHRRVDQIGVERAELFRIVAALRHLLAILRIAQHGDEHFVELQIAAAGVGEAAHRLLVGLAEIVQELVQRPDRPAC